VGSIRHCSRSPFAAIARAVLYGRAAFRRPGHAFRLNPDPGPRLSGVRHWGCAGRWPGLHLRVGLFRPVPPSWPGYAERSAEALARYERKGGYGANFARCCPEALSCVKSAYENMQKVPVVIG